MICFRQRVPDTDTTWYPVHGQMGGYQFSPVLSIYNYKLKPVCVEKRFIICIFFVQFDGNEIDFIDITCMLAL